MSRRKGAGYEREIAIALRAVYPGAKRGLGQARSASEVPDIDGTSWWIETKHRRRVAVRAAYAQAVRDSAAAKDARPPLVITRENREADLVTLRLSDFLRLVDSANATDEFVRDAEELKTP